MYRLLDASSTLNAAMHSKPANTEKVATIRSFHECVRKLGRGVLRYHLAMLMRNR